VSDAPVAEPGRAVDADAPTRSLVCRVWLPDRPGGLGAVASRIGGVGGDVHEIEVVDRGAGRAVDEFLVTVPAAVSDDLLTREIEAVDGVDVEELRSVEFVERDARIDALQAAVALSRAEPGVALAAVLVERARHELSSVWAAVVGPDGIEASVGEAPERGWLTAFGLGAAAGAGDAGVATDEDGEVAWAAAGQDRVLLTGRSGVPFRPRERRVLQLLAELASTR
jgi:hypothetical protein